MKISTNLLRKDSYSDLIDRCGSEIIIDTFNSADQKSISDKLESSGIKFTLKNFDEYDIWVGGTFVHIPNKFSIDILNITEEIFSIVHNIVFKIFVTECVGFDGK